MHPSNHPISKKKTHDIDLVTSPTGPRLSYEPVIAAIVAESGDL